MREPDPNGETRLDAMRAQRERIVSALDTILADEAFAPDELHGFVRTLIPLFDAPQPDLPRALDAIADVVDAFAEDPAALDALDMPRGGARPRRRARRRPLHLPLGFDARAQRARRRVLPHRHARHRQAARGGLPEPSCKEQREQASGTRERPSEAVPLANGDYAVRAWFVGLGFRYRFAAAP